MDELRPGHQEYRYCQLSQVMKDASGHTHADDGKAVGLLEQIHDQETDAAAGE